MQFEEETPTPEKHSVRTQVEFCIHDGDSDEWVSAASDEEKLKRAVTQDQQEEKYSDALSVDSDWEQRMNVAADLGLVDIWCTKNDVHMSAKEDHPAIVQAARRGDAAGVRRILDRNPEQVNAHRKRTEVEESCGSDKVEQWNDDTARLTAARNVHVAVQSEMVTTDFVRKARKKRLAVHVWTVNDEDAMQRIVNFGVDGIVTDEPQLLKRTLERMRRQCPRGNDEV